MVNRYESRFLADTEYDISIMSIDSITLNICLPVHIV